MCRCIDNWDLENFVVENFVVVVLILSGFKINCCLGLNVEGGFWSGRVMLRYNYLKFRSNFLVVWIYFCMFFLIN